jgi:hypothetical protein
MTQGDLDVKPLFIRSIGAACVVLFVASANVPVRAATGNLGIASINNSMLACQPLGPSVTDLRHTEAGTSTEGIFPTARYVTCSVPRTPQTSGAATATFYVSGNNIDGRSTTTCTLSSYEYTGTLVGSVSFTTSAAHYKQLVEMPAWQLGPWAYTSLTCLLPPNNRATIDGVVALP